MCSILRNRAIQDACILYRQVISNTLNYRSKLATDAAFPSFVKEDDGIEASKLAYEDMRDILHATQQDLQFGLDLFALLELYYYSLRAYQVWPLI
jgi:hypothetical protein